ncbi:LOW QUALITY PROTEIN: hypothetical protein Dda_2321 [Drechslerella dactyloides]|uniref:Ribosomal protein S17 n=1 Tax=Drechslerella dactyloides TaxID=74499 RepID=A0AAD6J3N9_DREDA|nr:LOW QUALITY PROTEIN: hypothetical protein Dda_2321 [Drechslerella dactyloides]
MVSQEMPRNIMALCCYQTAIITPPCFLADQIRTRPSASNIPIIENIRVVNPLEPHTRLNHAIIPELQHLLLRIPQLPQLPRLDLVVEKQRRAVRSMPPPQRAVHADVPVVPRAIPHLHIPAEIPRVRRLPALQLRDRLLEQPVRRADGKGKIDDRQPPRAQEQVLQHLEDGGCVARYDFAPEDGAELRGGRHAGGLVALDVQGRQVVHAHKVGDGAVEDVRFERLRAHGCDVKVLHRLLDHVCGCGAIHRSDEGDVAELVELVRRGGELDVWHVFPCIVEGEGTERGHGEDGLPQQRDSRFEHHDGVAKVEGEALEVRGAVDDGGERLHVSLCKGVAAGPLDTDRGEVGERSHIVAQLVDGDVPAEGDVEAVRMARGAKDTREGGVRGDGEAVASPPATRPIDRLAYVKAAAAIYNPCICRDTVAQNHAFGCAILHLSARGHPPNGRQVLRQPHHALHELCKHHDIIFRHVARVKRQEPQIPRLHRLDGQVLRIPRVDNQLADHLRPDAEQAHGGIAAGVEIGQFCLDVARRPQRRAQPQGERSEEVGGSGMVEAAVRGGGADGLEGAFIEVGGYLEEDLEGEDGQRRHESAAVASCLVFILPPRCALPLAAASKPRGFLSRTQPRKPCSNHHRQPLPAAMSAAAKAVQAAAKAAKPRGKVGIIVSAGMMPKMVKVRVPTPVWNEHLRKYFHRHVDILSHDERSACRAGDVVRILPIERASKLKRHMVAEVISPFGTGDRIPIETPEELDERMNARRTVRSERRAEKLSQKRSAIEAFKQAKKDKQAKRDGHAASDASVDTDADAAEKAARSPKCRAQSSYSCNPSLLTLGRMLFKLALKSSSMIGRMSSIRICSSDSPRLRSGPIAASFASAVISDPEKSKKIRTCRISRSVNVCFCCPSRFFICTTLTGPSGSGMYCRRTNRRRAASSIAHGRFVAASTSTRDGSPAASVFFTSLPAAARCSALHWIRNSVLIRRVASCSPLPLRVESRLSISSMKMIDGASAFANWNSARTSFSDSPSCQPDDAEMEKNVDLLSVATARASIVFPVPGGPNSSMPLAGSRSPRNKSGRRNGYTTASLSANFATSSPAISSQCTSSPLFSAVFTRWFQTSSSDTSGVASPGSDASASSYNGSFCAACEDDDVGGLLSLLSSREPRGSAYLNVLFGSDCFRGASSLLVLLLPLLFSGCDGHLKSCEFFRFAVDGLSTGLGSSTGCVRRVSTGDLPHDDCDLGIWTIGLFGGGGGGSDGSGSTLASRFSYSVLVSCIACGGGGGGGGLGGLVTDAAGADREVGTPPNGDADRLECSGGGSDEYTGDCAVRVSGCECVRVKSAVDASAECRDPSVADDPAANERPTSFLPAPVPHALVAARAAAATLSCPAGFGCRRCCCGTLLPDPPLELRSVVNKLFFWGLDERVRIFVTEAFGGRLSAILLLDAVAMLDPPEGRLSCGGRKLSASSSSPRKKYGGGPLLLPVAPPTPTPRPLPLATLPLLSASSMVGESGSSSGEVPLYRRSKLCFSSSSRRLSFRTSIVSMRSRHCSFRSPRLSMSARSVCDGFAAAECLRAAAVRSYDWMRERASRQERRASSSLLLDSK